jgi:hypothetical protein|tara:strand:+ start:2837 stop:3046 length:210 start_codon:yes stop_codon:yes gene_type:complete
MRAGQVKMWLDQGPAVLVEHLEIEGESIRIEDEDIVVPTREWGWVIHLLQTNELLTVHEETLHNGETYV